MLTRRIIVCLDVDAGRVVKGVEFVALRDVGDPVELACRHEADGADEIVFLDVSASNEGRATMFDVVRRAAEQLSIPLTVGGGIRTANDVGIALRAGADRVALNSAAVAHPEVLSEAAARFGAQCVVASIDAKRRTDGDGWEVFTHGGRRATGLDAVEWSARCAELGAGEVLLTSIDRDGTRGGYDLALTGATVRAVSVPVVASGGAGSAQHVVDVLTEAGADAALVAGIVHDGVVTIPAIKQALAERRIPVRL
jgi:cyclase